MNKIVLTAALLVLAGWAFQALDYGLATVLKGPISVTGLSGTRFIRFQWENVTRIEFEEADGELTRVNEPLGIIDLATFHPVGSPATAAGPGRVDMHYRDKNYHYTIHDGEEKYVVRHVR